jgi:methyltransferase family protein
LATILPHMSITEAHAAIDAGDPDRAASLLRKILSGTVDTEVLNDLAVVEHMRGDAAQAEALLRTALAIDPDDADANANLADLLGGARPGRAATWRASDSLGGPDSSMPERAFPGMPHTSVMAEHAARYAFAMQFVGGLRVLDLGCGTGYGSEMLTWVAGSVRGFDLWRPAPHERPAWPGGAELTYGHDLCSDPLPPADAAVAFEVVEHLADAPAMLRATFAAAPALVTSFPNPKWHGSHHNPHHVNDWTLDEFEGHLAQAAPGGRAITVQHYWQASDGGVVAGRDPDASYWILTAAVTD